MQATDTEAKSGNVEASVSCDPIIETALEALDDARLRTLREMSGIKEEWLYLVPPMGHNTIGTILAHMPITERNWLYEMLLRVEPHADIQAIVPQADRDETGMRLKRQEGASLDDYRAWMRIIREKFVEIYRAMSVEEYRRTHEYVAWNGVIEYTSAEKILYHLINHEAEHRGEMVMITEHFREQEAA
jgi:uncharacterized damage-inducible protein DinB